MGQQKTKFPEDDDESTIHCPTYSVYHTKKKFRWMWVIIERLDTGNKEDGYVLGQGHLYYTNTTECAKAAKKWLETCGGPNYASRDLPRRHYLIIEASKAD